jgi:hypothetical protein
MKTHTEIINKWLGKRYREPWISTYECVGWSKKYCEEAHWITWLSFGGSAFNGWGWQWNLDKFFTKVWHPKQGDLAFFNKTPTNPYWHVAVVNDTTTICEQNWWKGSWTGLWSDAIRISKPPLNVLWYMTPTNTEQLMPIDELRKIWQWVKVRKFNDYSQDERAKMIFDIWLS